MNSELEIIDLGDAVTETREDNLVERIDNVAGELGFT